MDINSGNQTDSVINNVSSFQLLYHEESLLKYGLKFCPAPENYNKVQENCERTDCLRKLKLIEYFKDTAYNDISIVKPKSNFEPPAGRSRDLDNTITFLNSVPPPTQKGKPTYNISLFERTALNNLRANQSIVIKEADKGSSVIIMDLNYYKEKIKTILNDSQSYENIHSNIDKTVMNKIKKITEKYKGILTEQECKYLSSFESKTSLFYGMPKIHKCESIINAIKCQKKTVITLKDPPDLTFRPIVAGTNCPTHRVSHFVDILLQPFCVYVRSYVRDSLDVLSKLPKIVNDSTALITFDVEALYTNISHDLGLRAIEYWLNAYPQLITRITPAFILESIKLILENNTFEFDGNNYRQITGTAMGTKCAPAYATLCLGYLEIDLYRKIDSTYSEAIGTQFKNAYKRFLDDVLIIMDLNHITVEAISSLLNDLNENLVFKKESSGMEVHFLDLTISIKNKVLQTDLFYKPTDSKQYLNFKSCHPRHTKQAIPYNLARRICTIVSEIPVRECRLIELKMYLQKCNYPENMVLEGIKKAKSIPKTVLLNNAINKTNTKILPFVSIYNPNYSCNFNIMKYAVDNLKRINSTKNIYKDVKLVNSKKQNKNLKQLLSRAILTSDSGGKVTKCGSPRCELCDILMEGSTLTFKNKTFIINKNMSCDSQNCIYAIICNGCGEHYIGETVNLRLRANIHKDHVRRNIGLNVSRHIAECANSPNKEKFYIMPFFKLTTDSTSLRKSMESRFIKKYNPLLNRKI